VIFAHAWLEKIKVSLLSRLVLRFGFLISAKVEANPWILKLVGNSSNLLRALRCISKQTSSIASVTVTLGIREYQDIRDYVRYGMRLQEDTHPTF